MGGGLKLNIKSILRDKKFKTTLPFYLRANRVDLVIFYKLTTIYKSFAYLQFN